MTKLASPKTETELRALQRKFFKTAQDNNLENKTQKFKGLMEIIKSEVNIVTAIHNMKSNSGSKTEGVDGKLINDFLEEEYETVIKIVSEHLENYNPSKIRRVYIPKSNGKYRPLGIPVMIDRIIQECIKIVIEPILEAQFFKHSYGFRPYREAAHAIERIIYINNKMGYHMAVEGDIKGCFDNMNHRVLIKQLWNMGIKDRRLLVIISRMLKSPIFDNGVIHENKVGLPQGGILSPLLANAYMHKLDVWISKEWENKKLRTAKAASTTTTLRKHSTIKNPEFFVRYADDWVLITNSIKSAEYWKFKISKYLKTVMCLELSEEKTHITNMKKKPIKFLGFKINARPIGNEGKYVGYSYPDNDRVLEKVKALKGQINKVRHASNIDWTIHEINLLNSKIRGIMNYYACATGVNITMREYREHLKYSCYKAIKKRGGKWIPANQCVNLKITYDKRKEQVPAIKYKDHWYGIICISFATWQKVSLKNPSETPFTEQGIQLYMKRTGKQPLKVRVQDLLDTTSYGKYIQRQCGNKRDNRLYTFEFYMNRCYAFNRDKGKCKICGKYLYPSETRTHHKDPSLPNPRVNKVTNLITVCDRCHDNIHNFSLNVDNLGLGAKELKSLKKYRDIFYTSKSSKSNK